MLKIIRIEELYLENMDSVKIFNLYVNFQPVLLKVAGEWSISPNYYALICNSLSLESSPEIKRQNLDNSLSVQKNQILYHLIIILQNKIKSIAEFVHI